MTLTPPCSREMQVFGVVSHDDAWADVAAGHAPGEERGAECSRCQTCFAVAARVLCDLARLGCDGGDGGGRGVRPGEVEYLVRRCC